MRIGIDCRTILDEKARDKAGVAHYTYYLVKTLLEIDGQNEYVLFWPSTRPTSPASERAGGRASSGSNEFYSLSEQRRVEGLPGIEIQYFRFSNYKKFLPYIYSHLLIANQIQKAKLDVFHSPANIVPLGLMRSRKRPKLVTTIHDLAIYRHPEWFPPRQGFSIKYLVPQTIKKVDHIIAPSQATANDLTEMFHVSSSKISVIPHGVDFDKFQITNNKLQINSKYQIQNTKYILFVGTLEPRKNLVRLIQAYAALPQDILEQYDLVIAGQKGWKYKEIQNAKIKMQNDNPKLKDKIRFIGYYPGEKLPELMRNASVFVYPSLYEGFGLPVLEAMAAGVHVITSKGTAMEEIATSPGLSASSRPPSPLQRPGEAGLGRGRGEVEPYLLVNPYSSKEISSAIEKILRNPILAREMNEGGVKMARKCNWEKTAQKTLAVYRTI